MGVSYMNYETILVNKSPKILTITINRPDNNNSINSLLMDEMNSALDLVENDSEIRIVVLEGQNGVFCTGMDFKEISNIDDINIKDREAQEKYTSRYFQTLKRFTQSPKVVVSKVDGRVNAGGVGLVAASDYVVATERSSFSLSEALFGLLPAMVIPFLIRRVGFQKAYLMTMTTQQISAQRGYEVGLVDELSEDLDETIRRFLVRIGRIKETTVLTLKSYFQKMWIMTEQMEEEAVKQITNLICNPENIEGIKNFIKDQKFPWQ